MGSTLLSVILSAVSSIILFTSLAVRFGFAERTNAATPATVGAALEVPPNLSVYILPGVNTLGTPNISLSVVQIPRPGKGDNVSGSKLLLGAQTEISLPQILYLVSVIGTCRAETAITSG